MNIVSNKNVLSSLIKESISTDNKKQLKDILATFKSNNMLSEAYFAIDNIQYGIVKENIRSYIIEHVNILRKNKKALLLIKNVKPFVTTPIDEDIEYLINNTKTAKNYSVWEGKIFNIASHIKKNTELASQSIDKNKILESLKKMPENHKILIKELALAPNKQYFYEDYKNACLLKIENMLKEEKNKEHKLLLYEVQERIDNLEFNEKQYVKDIVMITRVNEMIS